MACPVKSSSFLSEPSAKRLPSFSPTEIASFRLPGQSVIPPNQKATCFSTLRSANVHASYKLKGATRWWEKTATPNMIEIKSTEELVETLKNAGDTLVVVHFYSPSCGGCRALHPKVYQLAESYPEAIFLKVNHEELKNTCHALHIHLLPFFRLYKGSQGRLCSFSCTLSTIKKLKDALAKYSTQPEHNIAGPAKGLDESELLKLASIGEIPMILNTPLASSMAKEEIEHFTAQKNPTVKTMTGVAKNDSVLLVA